MVTALVLSLSDQSTSPLSLKGGLNLHVSYDIEANLVDPLRKIFSSVIVFDVLAHYVNHGPTSTNKEIKAIIQQQSPDYLIWLSSMYEIEPELLAFAQDSGVKTISWFFDDEMRFDNYSVMWIPVSDVVLTASPTHVDQYRKMGVQSYLTFMAPNNNIFHKMDLEKDIDVLFIGSNIADRQEFVDYLKQHNIDVTTFGKGWDSGYLSQTCDLTTYYNRAKINICFTKGYDGSKKQYKGKLFEICMCGGFVLVEYIDGMETFFDENVDMVFFRDKEELLIQIKKYLALPNQRQIIAENGYRKVMHHYTMDIQLSNIFKEIFQSFDHEYKKEPEQLMDTKKKIPNLKDIKKFSASYHFSFALAHLKTKNISLFIDEYRWVLKENIVWGLTIPILLIIYEFIKVCKKFSSHSN